MRPSQISSTLAKASVLSLALASGPFLGAAAAQTTDPARTPMETQRTTETRDDGFDWGWLGLLGLVGLAGLKGKEDPKTYRESPSSHARV